MSGFRAKALAAAAFLLAAGCAQEADERPQPVRDGASEDLVPYEAFELDNGLKVIFHIDRSDPVVAVALTAHVGSGREKPGRTGFAHLFEHLLFLESENLGKGGLDAMSARIGGSGANGSTNRDRTNYFQTVPNDALEKMIWAEADKLGWFINTVTEPVLAKEKQVVKNEKRQSYDNQPYGHTFYVIDKALYPEDHPYNWQVIGSLEDLDAATLDDVKEFYRDWYTPNNVVLTIAGDFDPDEARRWVHQYFDEIPRGPEVAPLKARRSNLAEIKKLFHEDNFAQLPELTLAWPTVPEYAPDYHALDVLGGLLTDGKSAPLNEVLIDDKKLTAAVDTFGDDNELAGARYFVVRGFGGVDLDAVKAAFDEGLARLEAEGIAEKDLQRVKTRMEVGFYGAVATVLGKAVNLGEYEAVYADADLINRNIDAIRAVTAEDVMRVYETYIKDKPYVATSFVPKGASELALEGSVRADVVEEEIVQGVEEAFDASIEAEYERTPSTFDRSVEPPYGPPPEIAVPEISEAILSNGLELYGVETRELPLVSFQLSIEGGLLLENPETPGAANLLAEIMDKGTAKRTTAELEEALALLGATVSVGAGDERFVISGQTLARNLNATLDIVREMLLEPRWDETELALAKARVASSLQDTLASPNDIADRAYALVSYGKDHVFARDVRGTKSAVEAMTMDDLKAYYEKAAAPGNASFRFVGAASLDEVRRALAGLENSWTAETPALSDVPSAITPETSAVYFYDMPGAKQSVFRFGRPAPKRTDDDFYPAVVMNYRLGGGGFASRLTQELREGKGYTYGIGSGFNSTARQGDFNIASSVRSNVTLEAVDLVRNILAEYGATFTEQDLDVTKSFLLKSQARAFESFSAKLGLLGNIADYGLAHDYVKKQAEIAEAMTVEDVRAVAAAYVRPEAMNYVIVGDAATQATRLDALGLGAPVMLNERVDGAY